MIKKTIIALQGSPNTGKSLTIGVLYDFMKKDGFQIIEGKKRKNSKDFFVILKKNGVLIGITTYGDTAYLINDRSRRFVKANCSIILCACHLEGKTVEAVNGISSYSSKFVRKEVASKSKQVNANQNDAFKLLKILNALFIFGT